MKEYSKKQEQVIQNQQVRLTKRKLTVQISENIIERVKNAVWWTPGLTLSEFSEKALVKFVDDLENENGGPFVVRKNEKMRSGRPLR